MVPCDLALALATSLTRRWSQFAGCPGGAEPSTKCCSDGPTLTPADATFAPLRPECRHRRAVSTRTFFFFYIIQMPIWQRMKMEHDVSIGAERCSTRIVDCVRVTSIFFSFFFYSSHRCVLALEQNERETNC